MGQKRIRKPKRHQRRCVPGEPLETLRARPASGDRLVESIEELMDEIDRALGGAAPSA